MNIVDHPLAHDEHQGHHHCSHSSSFEAVKFELLTHLPYAIFSVAVGMIILSFLRYISLLNNNYGILDGSHMLFHSFHFMHLVFAATGTMITFLRFSRDITRGIIISTVSPIFFCLLFDVILPYLGGKALGVDMHFHICFISELHNVIPFLAIGLLNGALLHSKHSTTLGLFSVSSHFIHILVSSLASLFYLVSHGFTTWEQSMGYLFLFLIFAVVVPCTLSDVVVPMYFARAKNEKY